MNRASFLGWVFGLLTVFGLAGLGTSQETLAPPKNSKPALQNGIEVQARGPVHEAFAQPIGVKPEAGPMVPKEPPPGVPEEPPEQKPDADSANGFPATGRGMPNEASSCG